MACPTSFPPWAREQIAPGKPFFSRTSAMTFVVATDTNGVVGAPFQTSVLPQTCRKWFSFVSFEGLNFQPRVSRVRPGENSVSLEWRLSIRPPLSHFLSSDPNLSSVWINFERREIYVRPLRMGPWIKCLTQNGPLLDPILFLITLPSSEYRISLDYAYVHTPPPSTPKWGKGQLLTVEKKGGHQFFQTPRFSEF